MVKKEISVKEIRKFSLVFGIILVTLFGLILPWVFHKPFPFWPWIVSLILMTCSIFTPNMVSLFYRSWMLFGLILGFLNTRIILSIVFVLIFTPLSIIMRIRGRDLLMRKLDPDTSTYRVNCKTRNNTHMERMF